MRITQSQRANFNPNKINNMNIRFTTHQGEKVALKMIDSDKIEIIFKNKNIILNESDLTKLEQSIYKIQQKFDSVYFADLQRCIRFLICIHNLSFKASCLKLFLKGFFQNFSGCSCFCLSHCECIDLSDNKL